jgi:pSer/pThr/pTyr-binding forkhead associated (FHA) protein
MEQLTAYLLLERGPRPRQQFTLAGEQMTIGRSAANEAVIVDPEVSRRHARVVRQAEQFAVEDLGSTNGTFLNGHRVTHLTALENGDLIELGDSISLRFMTTQASTPVPVASGSPTLDEPPDGRESPLSPTSIGDFENEAAGWNEAAEEPGDFVYYSGPEAELLAEPQPAFSRPDAAYAPYTTAAPRPRRVWVGCLLAFLAITLLCAGALIFLDAYDQGRLLYCGPLRPYLELILGPFGFAPLCS